MLRRSFLALVFLLSTVVTFAQEVTSVEFYMVPAFAGTKGIRPKYFGNGDLGAGWFVSKTSSLPYGQEGIYLVAAEVTVAQHITLSALNDVVAFGRPLDGFVSALELTGLQNQLEAANAPGAWITTGHTKREVVRAILKFNSFAEAFSGLFPNDRLFPIGVTLATRFNQLTQAQKDRLTATSDALGLDRTGLTATMTLRQILLTLGPQLKADPMMGEIFQ